MKTHRIILPAAEHARALKGVDRLLLPILDGGPPEWEAVPCAKCNGSGNFYCWQDGQPGREWCPSCGGGQYDFVPNPEECPYTPGDRLALLEPWSQWVGLRSSGTLYKADGHEMYKVHPASRMPLRACRCFYRVLSVEPVRDGDTWKWSVGVERI